MSTVAGELLHSPSLTLDSEQPATDFEAEEYGFAFIKSGFEHVRHALESDFNKYGLEVVGASPVILKPAVVDYIYRDSLREPFYPAMFRHLTVNPVIAMALHSEVQNTQDTLNNLKHGLNGLPSLRKKYGPYDERLTEDEIAAWYSGTHPQQHEVTVRLTQNNVFHAADSSEEAIESLHLIGIYNPEFWNATRQEDPRVKKIARYLTMTQASLILL